MDQYLAEARKSIRPEPSRDGFRPAKRERIVYSELPADPQPSAETTQSAPPSKYFLPIVFASLGAAVGAFGVRAVLKLDDTDDASPGAVAAIVGAAVGLSFYYFFMRGLPYNEHDG